MVAVVLILVIVSVAGAALYRTSLATMGDQFTSFAGQLNDETLAAKERFEVVSVEYVDSQTIIAHIFNFTPDQALTTTVSRIYVDGVNADWSLLSSGTLPFGTIPKNEVVPFTIMAPTGIVFAQSTVSTIKLVVVSQRGVSIVYP